MPAASPALVPAVAFDLEAVRADEAAVPAIEIGADAAVPAPAGAGLAEADDDCDLTAAVQQAVREDPAARAALVALPPADRSVANAVMLWDGRWIDGSSAAARATLSRVRSLVSSVVRDASPLCRAAVQTGPRLLAISGPPDVVLALGSGRWRWGDLADPDTPTTNTPPPTTERGTD